MHKVDCEINNWLASDLKVRYDWIEDATADCEEDYNPWDVVFTACTKSGDRMIKKSEVKSLKSGYQFKYDGQWNNYFSTSNPDGIIRKMAFGNVPPHDMDILDVPFNWEPDNFHPEKGEMPEEWENKHIYILNAEDKYHRVHNSKAYKITHDNICLCYVAPDGYIIYNPSTLKKAFLGYAWFQVKSHTEEFGEKYCPVYELKAVYDLDKGVYNEAKPPKELFYKKLFN